MNRAHYLVLLTALLLSLMTAVSLANESNNGPDGTNANEPHGTDSSGAESEAPSTADTESTTIDSEDAVEQAPPAGSGEPAPSTETGDHPQNCESVPSILDSQNRYKSDNPGYDPASQSGVHPYREWLFEPTSQEAVEQINSYVSQRFGDDVLDRLDSGLVGTPSDHTSQRIAVVVDPAVVDIAELQADFDAEVGPDIALVVPSCNSAQAIRDVIVALRTDNDIWGDSERQFDIDARRQVVKVGFKPRSPAAEQFLNAEFGDLVELSEPYTPYAGNRRHSQVMNSIRLASSNES